MKFIKWFQAIYKIYSYNYLNSIQNCQTNYNYRYILMNLQNILFHFHYQIKVIFNSFNSVNQKFMVESYLNFFFFVYYNHLFHSKANCLTQLVLSKFNLLIKIIMFLVKINKLVNLFLIELIIYHFFVLLTKTKINLFIHCLNY